MNFYSAREVRGSLSSGGTLGSVEQFFPINAPFCTSFTKKSNDKKIELMLEIADYKTVNIKMIFMNSSNN